MIGRTHGVHAEPITFGLVLANFYDEMDRNLKRFAAAAEEMRVGKFSGAVGNGAHLDPDLEEMICERLGLHVAPITSQVIQRDRHANYVATLAVIACTLDRIATEVRHLQRTEVREAEEFFSEKQKGSSAMPHKRNPVTCEQISGLARVVRSNVQAAYEDVALWHERDISHSSVERVILPDSTILLDYLLYKTTNLMDTLLVYPARMQANLDSTGGLGLQRTIAARSGRSWSGSRRCLPNRAAQCHARVEGRRGLPRNGAQRPGYQWEGLEEAAREGIRSKAAIAERGQDFRSRVWRRSQTEGAADAKEASKKAKR